jgi:hypothetical protein
METFLFEDVNAPARPPIDDGKRHLFIVAKRTSFAIPSRASPPFVCRRTLNIHNRRFFPFNLIAHGAGHFTPPEMETRD